MDDPVGGRRRGGRAAARARRAARRRRRPPQRLRPRCAAVGSSCRGRRALRRDVVVAPRARRRGARTRGTRTATRVRRRACTPPPRWSCSTEAVRADLRREYGVDATHAIPNGRSHGWVLARPKEPIVLGAGRLWDEAEEPARPRLRWRRTSTGRSWWRASVAGEHARAPVRRLRHRARSAAVRGSRRPGWRAPRCSPRRLATSRSGWARSKPRCPVARSCSATSPTAREVWGDRAVFVDPDDPGDLRRGSAALCADPARCVSLGERARERARELTPGEDGRRLRSRCTARSTCRWRRR